MLLFFFYKLKTTQMVSSAFYSKDYYIDNTMHNVWYIQLFKEIINKVKKKIGQMFSRNIQWTFDKYIKG